MTKVNIHKTEICKAKTMLHYCSDMTVQKVFYNIAHNSILLKEKCSTDLSNERCFVYYDKVFSAFLKMHTCQE